MKQYLPMALMLMVSTTGVAGAVDAIAPDANVGAQSTVEVSKEPTAAQAQVDVMSQASPAVEAPAANAKIKDETKVEVKADGSNVQKLFRKFREEKPESKAEVKTEVKTEDKANEKIHTGQ